MKRETLYTLYWLAEHLPFVKKKPKKEESEESDTDDVDIFDENDDE